MSALALWSVAIGVVEMAAGFWMAAGPRSVRHILNRFPRHRGAAWVFTTIGMAWAGWALYQSPLGGLERYKPLLVGLLPVAWILVVTCMDELLAPRALGGILLLLPDPILRAGRFHPSPWRYVLLVAAYVMAIKGLALLLSPYLFRRACEKFLGSDPAVRRAGFAVLAVGTGLVLLGILAY